jgi:UDP-N-acetylmuramoyl-L-alanyl-D-glutamate--2,6-diaminopimelate ligase
MEIRRLLEGIRILETRNGNEEKEVTKVTVDSRAAGDGAVFVAIRGHYRDGHSFLPAVAEAGASAAVVEAFTEGITLPQYRVENAREALSKLCDTFYGSPSRAMGVVGITATNGKTTTTYMLDSIYQEAGFRTGVFGSVRIKVGDEHIASSMTTPDASDIHRYFSIMKEKGIEKVSMEVSSSALEQYRVNDVDFDIVAFNNFSREHIDQHGTFEKYFEAKSSLITKAEEKTFAVLNLDDAYARSLVDKTRAKVVTYSVKDSSADISCGRYDLEAGKPVLEVVVKEDFPGIEGTVKKGSFMVNLGVPGYHSITNALSVISIALIDGVPVEAIQAGLKHFTGVERRFQYVYDREFIIIDDHFANSSNIDVTLENLVKLDYKRLHLVYAIRGNRGTTVNRENLETLLRWKDRLKLDEVIGTKSLGLVTEKDTVMEEELAVYHETLKDSGLKVLVEDRLEDAIAYALEKVEEGDIILLAGSQGMDYGAQIALEQIHEKNKEIPEKELFRPLKDRTLVLDKERK